MGITDYAIRSSGTVTPLNRPLCCGYGVGALSICQADPEVVTYLFDHRLPSALFPPDCHRYEEKKITGDELDVALKRMAAREAHTGKKPVVETAIITGQAPRIKIERWIVMCSKAAWSTT
jgi:hypothetical protein